MSPLAAAPADFYQFLRLTGVANMANESHYGLSLVLGGGEVTGAGIRKLYALLANRGELRAASHAIERGRIDAGAAAGEEASFITLDMLRQHTGGWAIRWLSVLLRCRRYWKTGTSWGFSRRLERRNLRPHVLVVWEGNFDGRGNNALVGAEAAAPLFFNIIDSVNASYPGLREPKHPFPPTAAAGGDLSRQRRSAGCSVPAKGKTWFIPGKSPIKVTASIGPWCWIFTAARSFARRMTRRRLVPKSLNSGLPIWPTCSPRPGC